MVLRFNISKHHFQIVRYRSNGNVKTFISVKIHLHVKFSTRFMKIINERYSIHLRQTILNIVYWVYLMAHFPLLVDWFHIFLQYDKILIDFFSPITNTNHNLWWTKRTGTQNMNRNFNVQHVKNKNKTVCGLKDIYIIYSYIWKEQNKW